MPFDPQPPQKDSSLDDNQPFDLDDDELTYQNPKPKSSKVEQFCLFPIKTFPFSKGRWIGVLGVVLQIIWSLVLLFIGLEIMAWSLLFGCIALWKLLGYLH